MSDQRAREKVYFIPMNKDFDEKYGSVLISLNAADTNIEWNVLKYSKEDDKLLFDHVNKGKKFFILFIDTEERSANLRSRVFLQHIYSQSVIRLWNRILLDEENDLNNFCFIVNRGKKERKLSNKVVEALQNLNEQNRFCVAECSDESGVEQAILGFVYEYYPHIKLLMEERKNPYILYLRKIEDQYAVNLKNWLNDSLSYIALSQNGLSRSEIQKLVKFPSEHKKEIFEILCRICQDSGGLIDFNKEEYKASFIHHVLSKMREREMRFCIIEYFKQFGCYTGSLQVLKQKYYLFVGQVFIIGKATREYHQLLPYNLKLYRQVKNDLQAQFVYSLREMDEVPYQYYVMGEWRRLYAYLFDLKVFSYIFKTEVNTLEKYWKALLSEGFLLSGYLELSVNQTDKGLLADAYNCIGIFCGYYFKQYSLALQYLNRTFEIYRKQKGDNDEQTLNVLFDIGTIYYMKEDCKEALGCFKLILQIKRTLYKDVNHTTFANVCVSIAMVYNAIGDYDSAILYCERVINIIEKNGETSIRIDDAYFVIAETYMLIGYYAESILWYKKAIDAIVRLTGVESNAAYVMNQLGNAYWSNGDYALALDIHLKTLNYRLKSENTNEIDIATSYYNLGRTYYMLNDYDKALEYLQEDKEISSGNVTFMALNKWWMSKCMMEISHDYQTEKEVLNEVIDILKNKAPDLIERRISVLLTFAECCLKLNEIEMAVEANYKAHLLYKERFGNKSHPLEAQIADQKAESLKYLHISPEATYKVEYQILKMFFGEEHPFTLKLLSKMNDKTKQII